MTEMQQLLTLMFAARARSNLIPIYSEKMTELMN